MNPRTLFITSLAFLLLLPTIVLADDGFGGRLKGKILLQVESAGEAWYVDPQSGDRVFMGRPADAFALMRALGLGVTNADLTQIAVAGEPPKNTALAKRLAGRILIQVEDKGQAWYVDPDTLTRHYLGRPGDAFSLMRKRALGIKNRDLSRIRVKESMADHELPVRHIDVTLHAESGSNQSGKAELYDFGAKTKVEITLTNAPVGVPQPARIHLGSCATMGAVKYPLSPLTNGKSETMLAVALDDILAGRPLAVMVHKSAAESALTAACGDITLSSSDDDMDDDHGNRSDDGMDENSDDGDDNSDDSDNGSAADDSSDDSSASEHEYVIAATNFAFSVKEIRVKQGDKVHIELRNSEGFHDLVLDEFDVATKQLQAGEDDSIEFTADTKGTFEYYCSVGSHRAMGMVGKLIVE